MAEANNSKISIATPFGPIAATGSMAIMSLLIVILLGYLYVEINKIKDGFDLIRIHMDQRTKDVTDVLHYNSCVARLNLWKSTQPREAPINFDTLPQEFLYCLPRFLVEKK